MGTGLRREFLVLKRLEGDLTDGKKEKCNFAFYCKVCSLFNSRERSASKSKDYGGCGNTIKIFKGIFLIVYSKLSEIN